MVNAYGVNPFVWKVTEEPIEETNFKLICDGSVDGLAATAAVLRHCENGNVETIFKQPHEVDSIDISQWPENCNVGFVGVGVNNRGTKDVAQAVTIRCLEKIKQAGHKICFVADEHDKEAWELVLEKCNIDISKLSIKPEDRDDCGSTCGIFMKAFKNIADDHTRILLNAGHVADNIVIYKKYTSMGDLINRAMKENIFDNSRRVEIAKNFAESLVPNDSVAGYIKAYDAILANHAPILSAGKAVRENDDTMIRYETNGLPIDPTVFCTSAYEKSSIIVVSGPRLSFIATNRRDIDVNKIINAKGITANGFAPKSTFARELEEAAIEAIFDAIKPAEKF